MYNTYTHVAGLYMERYKSVKTKSYFNGMCQHRSRNFRLKFWHNFEDYGDSCKEMWVKYLWNQFYSKGIMIGVKVEYFDKLRENDGCVTLSFAG